MKVYYTIKNNPLSSKIGTKSPEKAVDYHVSSHHHLIFVTEHQHQSIREIRLRQNSAEYVRLEDLVEYDKLLKIIRRQKVQVSQPCLTNAHPLAGRRTHGTEEHPRLAHIWQPKANGFRLDQPIS